MFRESKPHPPHRKHSVGNVGASSKTCLCGWSCIEMKLALQQVDSVLICTGFCDDKNISLETNKKRGIRRQITVVATRKKKSTTRKHHVYMQTKYEKMVTTTRRRRQGHTSRVMTS